MTGPRRVGVVTATRAEYGLLREVLRGLQRDPRAELQLVVTGTHLSPEFGHTVDAVEADGVPVADRLEMLLSSDTAVGATKSLGIATLGLADTLDRLRPDLLLLLGDRYEMLAAASAALLARVPVAHLHGGERTEGQIDEAVRHAVTKMAHLHLVAAEPYRRRVVQMGEDPDRVHVVGSPGLDQLAAGQLLDRTALEADLDLPLQPPVLLVTHHPVTLRDPSGGDDLRALLTALDHVPEATVVLTGSNADPAGREHAARLRDYAASRSRAAYRTSLGQERYLSLLAVADAVVGNSSSGLIEAPALSTPTVNVGPRQDGRLRAPSVVDCGETPEEVLAAIQQVLDPAFRHTVRPEDSPYGGPGASRRVVEHLLSLPLEGILHKQFHDLKALP